MDARDGAVTVIGIVRCPTCSRFLGKVLYDGSSVTKSWNHCRRCNEWKWCSIKVEKG